MKILTCAAMAVLATAASASAAIDSNETARLTTAAQVLRETRDSIPQTYWDRARCVAVIPDLKKAAFIIGGEYGKGVVSCRAGQDWSAPVFVQLAKGSWGFQAGAEEVDVVLLVMNESGVQKLLQNKISLGADASIAAGPVGRQGQIGTDVSMTTEILAYSRAQGLFAGINLSGGVLRPDDEANRDAYGSAATPNRILATRTISAPTQASEFIAALGKASSSALVAPPHEPTTQAAATAQAATVSRSTAVLPTTDSDLRTQIVTMQQTLDRLLSDQNSSVGTAGQVGDNGATVTVSRDRLRQLRSQVDALLAALNARGQ